MTIAAEPQRLSLLLELARSGARGALSSVFESAYPELCKMAHARLRGKDQGAGAALETTALVHETFLRLAQQGQLQVEDRAHFFRYAGRVMRAVIVDCVRERMAQRRGSGASHVQLTTEVRANGLGGTDEILRVHEALDGLAAYDPRLVEVVQLRYFGGMTDCEIAEVLGVTDRTVRRDWEKARLLLSEALAP
ncbi:MAG: putative polymerase sigma factor [Myxococcaceae bacterium]|nr:putative polymerase sigma factor [Myxococcaceae bacterium]